MDSDAPVLVVSGLTKDFAGTRALEDAALSVRGGEILALLGENGAGKSTLIKILAGVHEPDAGTVTVGGRALAEARRSGQISFIHQDLGLVDDMTVAENIALVNGYARRRGLISWRDVRREARDALAVLAAPIDVDQPMAGLSATERAIVGLARAVSTNASILVLDEPTAALPAEDVARLFGILRRLRDSGAGLIYVTHRLEEVFELADRVTVLRNGRVVAESAVADVTRSDLVGQILGRPLGELFVEPPTPRGEPVLVVDALQSGQAGPVSFGVQAGEVVGLVGRVGAGHDRIGRAIYGADDLDGGTVTVAGVTGGGSIGRSRAAGIEFATGRRQEEGMAAALGLRENLWMNLTASGRGPFTPERRGTERRRTASTLARYDVRMRDVDQPINTLSGGNQQKVVLARAMETRPHVLILEEPTAGVDVGAKGQIYRLIDDALENGMAVVMVSSDFEEVAATCFRALVVERGRVVAELRKPNVSQEQLIRFASGDRREEVQD